MPLEFRRLTTEEEFVAMARPYLNAYPSSTTQPDVLAKTLFEMSGDPANHFWTAFDAGAQVGGMRLLDFQLNYFGQFIPAGGVGGVWVDFIEKKRGYAKQIIIRFLDHYEEAGAHVALLYPFRPDFYHDMGFGYGPKQDHYSFAPASLPKGKGPHGLVYLTAEDGPLLKEFYDRLAARQHGFIKRLQVEVVGMMRGNAAARTIVGIKENGALRGYMTFGFKRYDNSFVKNDMLIREWLWDGPETLSRFCTFLNSQADQINRIQFNTQDENFHFLLRDVRDGSDNMIPPVYHQAHTGGVGLMYRIINVGKFLRATDYRNYGGETADVCLHVTDTFRPANAGIYNLRFGDGRLIVADQPVAGIKLGLDIADLSALLMGSVDIASLYQLGRADMSECDLPRLARLFAAERPRCITSF